MNWIDKIEYEEAGTLDATLLLEQKPGHYPEFSRFLDVQFEKSGGPLYFRGDSGRYYRLAHASLTRKDALQGVEVSIRTRGQQPQAVIDVDESIDLDLWPLLEWLIEGVNGAWTLEDLRKTGALYKVPGAPERG